MPRVFRKWRSGASRRTSSPASTGAHASDASGLTRDHVVWAYRLLLDRDPESDDVIGPKLRGSASTAELRRHLMTSAEFREKNPDYAHSNDPTVVIKELRPGLRLFIDLSDHVIGLNILRDRYEADAVQLLRNLLQPGDAAIDVGAHIGFFTIEMAEMVGPTGRVYAFEALDANADLLERSIAENHFTGRVVFRRAAVGAASGTATITFPIETLNTGGAYLLRDGVAPLHGNRTRDVPLSALDDLHLDQPVRMIKLDVEGAEPQVIRGAVRVLREHRPVILSELHPTQLNRASGVTADDFLGQMRALRYDPHVVEDGQIGAALDRVPLGPVASIVFVPQPA